MSGCCVLELDPEFSLLVIHRKVENSDVIYCIKAILEVNGIEVMDVRTSFMLSKRTHWQQYDKRDRVHIEQGQRCRFRNWVSRHRETLTSFLFPCGSWNALQPRRDHNFFLRVASGISFPPLEHSGEPWGLGGGGASISVAEKGRRQLPRLLWWLTEMPAWLER